MIDVDISPDGVSTPNVIQSPDLDRALAAAAKAADKTPSIADSPVEPVVPAANNDIPKTVVDDGPKADPPTDDNTSINDFLDLAGKELVKDEKPKEDPNKQQTTAKDTTANNDKQSLQTTPADSKVTPKADKTTDRDYSDIDEADREAFKRMHNDAYNLLKPIYKEHKTLKTENETLKTSKAEVEKSLKELREKGPQLPDSYFENPNGYLLNPDFQVAVREQNVAQAILNHWTQQHQKIAEGAKEIDFLDFDNNGNLAITRKIPADKSAESQLIQYVAHAQNQLTNATANVRALAANHRDKAVSAVKSFNDQTAQEYAVFDKPENKPIYEPLIKKELEALHPVFRNSPLAMSYAKSRVMVVALSRLLQQAAEERKNAANNPGNGNTPNNNGNQNRNKQPTAAQINGAGTTPAAKNNADDVTMDDFKAAKGID